MLKQGLNTYILFLITFLLYTFIAYGIERHETAALVLSYGFLFIVYIWVYATTGESQFTFWFYASLIFRGALVFAIPNLSDDFYRFIWDGRLLAQGYHPFAEHPSYYIENNVSIPGITDELFDKLNSKNYFTIYPPLAQFIFWISVKLSPHSIYGSVLIMKIFMITAEAGTLTFLKRLTTQFNIPSRSILLYALNPLVILELTGNLHFEAIMIFFLLLSFFLLTQGKPAKAAAGFAAAIVTKLLPIILLPVLLVKTSWKKAFHFYLITFIVSLIFFIPLYSHKVIEGFNESIGYYFQKFEFNASLYYIVKGIGYLIFGYNIIQTVGWKLAVLCTLLILLYSFYFTRSARVLNTSFYPRLPDDSDLIKQLPTDWMFIFLIYFFFTTTLHPWYITTLIALSVLSGFKFPIVWSAFIFLTYTGYTAEGFQENLWLTGLEYVVVIGYLVHEILDRYGIRKRNNYNLQ